MCYMLARLCQCCRQADSSARTSRQAVQEKQQQQALQAQHLSFQAGKAHAKQRSQSVGPQRPVGEQRLEQLSRPKTAHWAKCKYVCLSRNSLLPLDLNAAAYSNQPLKTFKTAQKAQCYYMCLSHNGACLSDQCAAGW